MKIKMALTQTPPYSIFPFVSNEKVALRQIVNSDLNDLIEISFYDGIQATTLEEAIAMNSKIDKDYKHGNSIHWGIIDQLSDKIVGTCGYYRGFNKGEGELGCVLLPQYQRQGFMTAAMQLAIGFGRKEMGLTRIWAATGAGNEKAVKLLKNLGFINIGSTVDHNLEFELPSNKVEKD